MSDSVELLNAINVEAIGRMSPEQLVDRAVSLRVPLYNALEIEPIEVEGGTLYTVTSGIVTDRALHAKTEVEDEELVRRQVAPRPMSLFADVVEVPDRSRSDEEEAKLYRVETGFDPVLAEVRAPFRPTILEAMKPGKDLPSVELAGPYSRYTSYSATHGLEVGDETILNSRAGGSPVPLLARPDTQVTVTTVATSEMDHEVGVRTSFAGPANVVLEPHQVARVTNNGVLVSPAEGPTVGIVLPDGTTQYVRGIKSAEYQRIPDDVTIAPDENGQLVMTGGRSDNEKYKNKDLRPFIDGQDLSRLLPLDEIAWKDATGTFLKSLARQIADVLPLDGAASWEQTLARARTQIREALLAGRKPVLGGIGNLAVAARMAELPGKMPGANLAVDQEFFKKVV